VKNRGLDGATALILLLAAGCATGAAPAVVPAPATPTVPSRALVTIVVDQLAAWIAAERWPELPADGGFARLRREGLYVRELRYDYASTDTAPGHSALYTGEVPRESGIVANDIIVSDDGAKVSILADEQSDLLIAGGRTKAKHGESLARLRGDTLADMLRARDPDAAIYGLSLKDRGALFGAGRTPTLALWFDPGEEAFVSSTAFVKALPEWVARVGGRDAVRAACATAWDKPLDRSWVEAHALTPDRQPGEGDLGKVGDRPGLGIAFPHAVPDAKTMRATPAGDRLLLQMSLAAIAHAAPAPHPTLLAISFSSNDYVGHTFGPDSWEAWDELRQLDQRLAELLSALDAAFGKNNYAVMLTGDHGIGAIPELEGRARVAACKRTAVPGIDRGGTAADCKLGPRLATPAVLAALEAAWQRELAPAHRGPFIAGIADALIFLNKEGRALVPDERARMARSGTEALHDRFNIDEVVDVRAAAAPCPPASDESRDALVCRSVRRNGPGDFDLVVAPRAFFEVYAPGAGANHGSPYLYDRAVPLLVRAPGRVAAGAVREQPVHFTTFVRTAASLLGVPAPTTAGAGENLAADPDGPRLSQGLPSP
jgi:hypothetical protein